MVKRVDKGSREGGRFAPGDSGKTNVPTVSVDILGVVNQTFAEAEKDRLFAAYQKFIDFKEILPDHKIGDYFDFVLNDFGPYNQHEYMLIAWPKGAEKIDYTMAGWIRWQKAEDDGTIEDIQVANHYRRAGIATALYLGAIRISETTGITRPRHHSVRTKEGDRWARSLGEPLPRISCSWCGEEGHPDMECDTPWAE